MNGSPGYRNGGIVGAYANGGIVGNGIWNQDSVLARYAGGGNIALAGGEGIITAPAMAAPGMASFVEAANRGYGPTRVPQPPREASGSNDNRDVVVELKGLRENNEALLHALVKIAGHGFEQLIETNEQIAYATESASRDNRRILGKPRNG